MQPREALFLSLIDGH